MTKPIKGRLTENLKTNVVFAKDQDDYNALPAHKTDTGIVAFAFEVSEEEIEEIKRTGRIYASLLTFNNPLQPVYVTGSADKLEENIDHNNQWLKEAMVDNQKE